MTPPANVLSKTVQEFEAGLVPTHVRNPETMGTATTAKDETEISLSVGVSLTVDKTAPAAIEKTAHALTAIMKGLALAMLAGSRPVHSRLVGNGNPEQNVYGCVYNARGTVIRIYFGQTEYRRFVYAMIKYSATLTGPALMHAYRQILTNAGERMTVIGLYFATACMQSLEAYVPAGAVPVPKAVADNKSVVVSTASSSARKRGRDAPASPGPRKHPGCCNEFQTTGRCTKPGCRFAHQCDLCKSTAHGSRICRVGFQP